MFVLAFMLEETRWARLQVKSMGDHRVNHPRARAAGSQELGHFSGRAVRLQLRGGPYADQG